ncbi:MAG: chitobiase/beta-hexosaminidase C-terminal domain-containing protein [Roseburia sp.]|nr:chitobiase/beta-hexosaminidase C-terminal domain-containing protein [Roseburia sp.]
MKCPKCGADIPENSLYCEQCGEDIHIVPDFEAEVEDNIQQTLQGIMEDISIETKTAGQEREEALRTQTRRRHSKRVILTVCLALFLALAAAGAVCIRRYCSLEYQVWKARQCVEKEQYEKAVKYYSRALELNEENISLKFALSEVYFLKNNRIEYEYLLRDIISSPDATTEELSSAYGKLIAIYRAREDYQTIHDLLLSSNNETIISTYQDYIAGDPEFSIQDGYYTDIQPLKITAFGPGKIFYTINGGEPDENSTQYTAPIILDEGDYTVKAYFVNELGISSRVVTGEYHIKIEQIPAPEISAVSGEYQFPIYIEVLEDDEDIYYTTDGSDPTLSSSMYTGPIPMPLGKTVFKFVKITEGRVSEIAERSYRLEMNTEYTVEQACRDVLQYAMDSGKIYDVWGNSHDTDSTYSYQYQYVINIKGINDFYIIAEVIRDTEGIQTKTGSNFAVNAYTGEIFKLQTDENNNYTLVGIQNESQEQG